MSKLQTSVIMKTDLRGSTPLFRSLVESELSSLLIRQKALISRLVLENDGRIIKGEGDAFWVTFPSVTTAAQTAIEIQQELRNSQPGKIDHDRIAIRIVIALGDVLHQANDIFGYPVNLTSRIETITPADEIYLSQAAWLALNQAEIDTAFAGQFTFKGVAGPENVYRVTQPYRSRVLQNQAIVMTDLKGFITYQKEHTVGEIESLLLMIESITQTTCEQHGGTIRFAQGDAYLITFPEWEAALAAVKTISQNWATVRQEKGYPSFSAGIHYGDLTLFRAYLYGDNIYIASVLQQMTGDIWPETTENRILTSHTVAELAAGSKWAAHLIPISSPNLPANFLKTYGRKAIYAFQVENKQAGEAAFSRYQRQVRYLEDINAPTVDEWSDVS